MSTYLKIHIDGEPDRQEPLTENGVIGQQESCAFTVQHENIAPESVAVSLHGNAVFVRNLNNFPLFVGTTKFEPASKQRWPEGEVITLATGVWVSLHSGVAQRVEQQNTGATAQVQYVPESSSADKRKNLSRMINIAVIAICACAAPLLLYYDGSKQAPVSKDSFESLVIGLRAKDTPESMRVLRHLQQAWRLENQSSSTRNNNALRAYELVLKCPSVQRAKYRNSDTIESRVKLFATTRVAYLRS